MNDSSTALSALVIEGLVKDFGGQRALDGVDLTVRRGEIHALLGENGAGKSTLIKVLAGVHRPDAGTTTVGDTRLPAGHTPADAARHGVHFVHQDLALIDGLSVAENIALDVGYGQRRGLVSMARTERRAAELLARQGVSIDPRSLVGGLPHAEKVMVALARAFHTDGTVIVLDEVSASLPGPEVARVQAAVRRAADDGVGIVWVTHRLDELPGFADRLTVLRDGRHVISAAVAGASDAQIVEWIVGREVDVSRSRPRLDVTGTPRLTVRGLTGPGLRVPLDFDVMAGEVLGLTGLIGAGADEVAALLGGSPRVTGGTVTLEGQALPIGRPRAMRLAGCNYVPGDRARDGAIPGLTVRENFFPVRIGTVLTTDAGVATAPSAPPRAAWCAASACSRASPPRCRWRRSAEATSRRSSSDARCARRRGSLCSPTPPQGSTSAPAPSFTRSFA